MKIYLLNDTSSYHAGSKAVMVYIEHLYSGHEIIARHLVGGLSYDEAYFNLSDGIVANGEGTIHHRADAGLFIMETLRKAQSKGKETHLINAVFQEKPPYYPDVLAKLTSFTVRDKYSLEWAEWCGGKPRLEVDLCAKYFVSKGRKIYRKSEGAFDKVAKGDDFFGSLNNALSGIPKIPIFAPFEEFVHTLSKQSLYITGQHHGVYAAALAGIPFVPIRSNSHKIEGLIAWSGIPIRVYDSADQITIDVINDAFDDWDKYRAFSDWLYEKAGGEYD